MTQKYPWTASQLDENDMVTLYLVRKATGRPITFLIKEAINKVYGK